MLRSCKLIAVLGATALTPMASQATTVMGDFSVNAAISDRNGKHISLWFANVLGAGLSKNFSITTPGTFSADATSGQLDADTFDNNGTTGGFNIDMTFDRDFSDNTITTPVFKAVLADVFAHGNEGFMDLEAGTLTGTGGLSGLDFQIVRAPADG